MTMLKSIARNEAGADILKTISEMSTIYGISLRTLRFYEDRGLLQPARAGTQRLYCGKDEVRLQLILKGKRLGFTLTEIEKLILCGVDRSPETETLAPEQAMTAVLTPALVQEKIETLTQKRDAAEAAIVELKQKVS